MPAMYGGKDFILSSLLAWAREHPDVKGEKTPRAQRREATSLLRQAFRDSFESIAAVDDYIARHATVPTAPFHFNDARVEIASLETPNHEAQPSPQRTTASCARCCVKPLSTSSRPARRVCAAFAAGVGLVAAQRSPGGLCGHLSAASLEDMAISQPEPGSGRERL
jgi:hypothetical protein